MEPVENAPSSRELFKIWLSIGVQSFGGGTATAALIRRVAVEERQWISDAEYARLTALTPLVPGMNLLALTALIGGRIGGAAGVWVSLLGLLLPSVTLTLVITALFARLHENPFVHAAVVNGVVPATVGIGLWNTFQNGGALLRESRDEGAGPLTFAVLLLAASVALSVCGLPVFALLLGGGAIGAAYGSLRRRSLPPPTPPGMADNASTEPETPA